jgi:hypothetical protein
LFHKPVFVGDIDEERRLCYVGVTRAKRSLTLSVFKSVDRGTYVAKAKPSLFLFEIREQFRSDIESAMQPVRLQSREALPFGLGAVKAYGPQFKVRTATVFQKRKK